MSASPEPEPTIYDVILDELVRQFLAAKEGINAPRFTTFSPYYGSVFEGTLDVDTLVDALHEHYMTRVVENLESTVTPGSVYARTTDPETSKSAAQVVAGAKHYRDKAVAWLREHDRPEGWTWAELEREGLYLGECGWHRLSDARRVGLANWVRDSEGRIVTRIGASTQPQGATRISPFAGH